MPKKSLQQTIDKIVEDLEIQCKKIATKFKKDFSKQQDKILLAVAKDKISRTP